MSSFADSLKKEISRIARKELRSEIATLRKSASLQRVEISGLKKQVIALQAALKKLSKTQRMPTAPSRPQKSLLVDGSRKGKPGRKVLFTAERLKTHRARLGFTQDQMAKLLEVSSLSIWKWESGGAVPRASRVPHILQRLALGKREAMAIVEANSQ